MHAIHALGNFCGDEQSFEVFDGEPSALAAANQVGALRELFEYLLAVSYDSPIRRRVREHALEMSAVKLARLAIDGCC